MKKTEQINFRTDPEISEMLERTSAQTGIPKAELIRLAIQDKYGDQRALILHTLAKRINSARRALEDMGIPSHEAKALIIGQL